MMRFIQVCFVAGVVGLVSTTAGGNFAVTLTSGTDPGTDAFTVTVDGGNGAIILAPEPSFEHFELGDLDGDGTVGIVDFLALLAHWS